MCVISVILHFEFFMVLSYCPLKISNVLFYKFSRILTLTKVISFRNLSKVQKSKLIKIIRYDDRQTTDRQINLRSNTHGCETTIKILLLLSQHNLYYSRRTLPKWKAIWKIWSCTFYRGITQKIV